MRGKFTYNSWIGSILNEHLTIPRDENVIEEYNEGFYWVFSLHMGKQPFHSAFDTLESCLSQLSQHSHFPCCYDYVVGKFL